MTTTTDLIHDLLRQHPGRVAVVVSTFEGAVLLEQNAQHVFPAASTIKLPLLIRALQHVRDGQLSLNQRIEVRAEDRVGGSGILRALHGGLQPTLLDLLTLMIIVSDNTATNLVIAQLGLADVNSFLDENRLSGTGLVGALQLPPERQNAAQRAGRRNCTSAHDMVKLLLGLVNGAWLPPELTALALDILGQQHYQYIIGRHVSRDEQGLPRYRVASKSGELPGVRHDVGIVWTPTPLVIALLSEGGRDLKYHPDNHEVQLLARIAGRVLQELGENERR